MKGIRVTAAVAGAFLLAGCGGTALKAGTSPGTAGSTPSASAPTTAVEPSNSEVQQALDTLWASRDGETVCATLNSQEAEVATLASEIKSTGTSMGLDYASTYVKESCASLAAAAEDLKAAAAAAAAEAKATAVAEAKAKAAAAAKAKAAKALISTKSYAEISKRSLAKIIRDPDSYVGKKYVIYGKVTQFDSATGTDSFRANVAYKNTAPGNYGYFEGENAMVDAGKADISDIVEDDIVKMYVTVVGSFSYDTQIGGNTTAPQFEANIIKRVS